jgi:hypothetical protein
MGTKVSTCRRRSNPFGSICLEVFCGVMHRIMLDRTTDVQCVKGPRRAITPSYSTGLSSARSWPEAIAL